MNNIEKIKEALIGKFTQNDFKAVTVTMHCNNDKVKIIPLTMGAKITKLEDVEYYLVESPSLPWLGGDNINTIAEQLASYESELNNISDERNELQAYYEEHIKDGNYTDDEFAYYSDWHKDLYGRRPH